MIDIVGAVEAVAVGSCSPAAALSATVNSNSIVLVQRGSEATLKVPVYTADGRLRQSDPGLRVVLSLVPSEMVEDLLSKYSITSSTGTAALRRMRLLLGAQRDARVAMEGLPADILPSRMRVLLQHNSSEYGDIQPYDYPSYMGEFGLWLHL